MTGGGEVETSRSTSRESRSMGIEDEEMVFAARMMTPSTDWALGSLSGSSPSPRASSSICVEENQGSYVR